MRYAEPSRGMLVALALILAVVWFGGLGHRKLIKPDEGRYAEIPRQMVATGDWLTPRLNGLKYFEKPPLQYWATATAYSVFGISEWTSRLWTALTGFLAVLACGFTAGRLYDRRTGLLAATVAASSLACVLLGHFNTLDMGLTFFMSVTLFATLLARDARVRDARSGRGWMAVAWIAMALAVLSKGPVAVVLPGGALFAYLAVTRDWTLLRMLMPVRGLALFLLVAGPWFVAVSRANPEFAHFFFIHEHIDRFLTTEHRREGPIWYFVPVLLVGLLPWLSVAVVAVVRGWRATPRAGFAPERLLLCWTAVVFVFFSLSGSKLASYILPVFPALAIVIGATLGRMPATTFQRHLWGIAALAAIAAAVVGFVPLDSAESRQAIASFRTAALGAMLVWLGGTAIAFVLARSGRITSALVATGLAALCGWSALLLGHEALGRGMSTFDLARRMQPYVKADTPIYSVGLYEHTLGFYLRRNMTLVSFRDELDFGLTQEPDKGIATIEAFADRWAADRAPLAVMAKDLFATLSAARLPMRVVANDGRRIVVAKPAESNSP